MESTAGTGFYCTEKDEGRLMRFGVRVSVTDLKTVHARSRQTSGNPDPEPNGKSGWLTPHL